MKKALSIILAVCMVLALVPAAFAIDNPTSITYNFASSYTGGVVGVPTLTDYAQTDGNWKYYGMNAQLAAKYGTSYGYFRTMTYGLQIQSAPGDIAQIVIKVPKKAAYIPTLVSNSGTLCQSADIYLAPLSDGANATADKYKIGTYNMKETASKTFDAVDLSADTEYVLSFSDTLSGQMCIENFSLVETDPLPKTQLFDFGYTSADTGKFNVGLATLDSTEKTGRNWAYCNMESSFATAYAGSWDLLRTLTGCINMTPVNSNGQWFSLTLKDIAAGTYDVDYAYATHKSGGIGDIYIAPATDSANATADKYKLGTVDYYEKDAAYKLGASEKLSKQLKAETAGDYIVTFKHTGDKNTAALGYQINPCSILLTEAEPQEEEEDDPTYEGPQTDFDFGYTSADTGKFNVGIATLDSTEKTGRNWNYEAMEASLLTSYTGSWSYVRTLTGYVNITPSSTSTLQWVALRLKNIEAGTYDVEYSYATYKNGGIGEVYIIPASALANAANYADALRMDFFKLGTVDYYDSTATGDRKLGAKVTFDKTFTADRSGDYIVVFKSLATHAEGSMGLEMDPASIKLTKTGGTALNFRSFQGEDGFAKGYPNYSSYALSGRNWYCYGYGGVLAERYATDESYFRGMTNGAQVQAGGYTQYAFKAPDSGASLLNLENYSLSYLADNAKLYLAPASDAANAMSPKYRLSNVDMTENPSGFTMTDLGFAKLTADAEYILTISAEGGTYPASLLVIPAEAPTEISAELSAESLVTGDKAEVIVKNGILPYVGASTTYSVTSGNAVTVDALGNVDAVAVGDAVITVTADGLTDTIAVSVASNEDAELKAAFTPDEETVNPIGTTAVVSAFAASIGGDVLDASLISNDEANLGEVYSTTAPDKEGYNFLYWAKGATADKKQIISYEKSLSFIPTVERTYLIAVYEPEEASATNRAEFFNGNGQLIEVKTESGSCPALPSMAGYGKATGWVLYGTEEIYDAEDPFTLSGTMIFVAQYGDLETVSVNGETKTYGDKVTFTANAPSGKFFKAWKKNGEIVSMDTTYSFYAWEDCTVEAIYEDAAPVFSGTARKILVSTFAAGDDTAAMAEFIGIDNAVEKGIMIGSKKIAMSSAKSQFTVLKDATGELSGYAILADGTTLIFK